MGTKFKFGDCFLYRKNYMLDNNGTCKITYCMLSFFVIAPVSLCQNLKNRDCSGLIRIVVSYGFCFSHCSDMGVDC